MKDRMVTIAGFLLIVIISFSIALAGWWCGSAQFVEHSSDYSIYEVSENPPQDTYFYPLANYTLVHNGNMIEMFVKLGVEEFEPGIAFVTTETGISHIDSYARLEIHEFPTTVVEFEAVQNNGLQIILAEGTGAIKSGDAVIVGNEDASGEFVVRGDVTATIDGSEVIFDVPAGASVIYRSDISRDRTIGSAVAGGRVAAEMFLGDDGGWVVEDVVSFDNVQMSAVAASEELVDTQVSGTVSTGKTVVLHISDSYLDYDSEEDIAVELDDKKVKKGNGMTETLWETGDVPMYYALKTSSGFDIVVYIPQDQLSDNVITIRSAEQDIGPDGLVTLMAAIGIVGVAVLALVKRD